MYVSVSTAYVYEVTSEPKLTKTKTISMEHKNLQTSGFKRTFKLLKNSCQNFIKLFDAFILHYVSYVCLHIIIEKF